MTCISSSRESAKLWPARIESSFWSCWLRASAPSIPSRKKRRLGDLERLVREQFANRSDAEPVPMGELIRRARSENVIVLDTRPANEYAAGHIAGAVSVPIDELQRRLRSLPKSKHYVAYCRGPYCVYADRAVEILKAKGRKARRLLEGFPEWKAAGLPVETGGSLEGLP